jgi:hypothetical protein
MSSSSITEIIWRNVKGFFGFWKDFLVGDSPVLAAGVLIILGVEYLLRKQPYDPLAVVVMVLVLMTYAVWEKTRPHNSM